MILLSIDVGIRNLAYILIQVNDIDKHVILKWDVLELIKPNEKANQVQNTYIGNSLCNQFDDILPKYNIDIILIENQIGQNAMIFFRYNQYRYFDPNFIENHLKGWETMLELKINF